MIPINYIAKRLGLFCLTFVVLTIIFSFKPVKEAHRDFYCKVGPIFFNVVNPYLYGDFIPEAQESRSKYFTYDMTFNIYDERIIKKKVNRHNKDNMLPTIEAQQNHKQFTLVPLVFLISLFIASPIGWKNKLLRFPVAFCLLYLFLGLYFSFNFENMISKMVYKSTFEVDSLWDCIIWLCGFGGTHDAIFVVVFFIWASLVVPTIVSRWREGKLFSLDNK